MPRISKLSDRQVALFCRGLSLQLHAGIPLADGIHLLAEDEAGECRNLLKQIGTLLDAGAQLSEALKEAGGFPEYVCGMVTVAEQTGKLEQTLQSLCGFYDRQAAQRRQIKNALSYPSMVFALMLLVVGVLLVKVLPVFESVYNSLGSRMTGAAAWLLSLGRTLGRALPAILAVLGASAVLVLLYRVAEPFRAWVNGQYQARFGDRGIGRKYNNARFAQGLAMGLSSGLPLEEALEMVEQMLGYIPGAARRCRICTDALAGGAALADAMAQAQLLPPSESRMLSVGLRGGNADRVMEETAQRLQQQAEEALEDAVSAVEPVMVLAASVLVGVILLAVMLPLMNIMSAIG